jgi:hypothetical protein
MCTVTDEENQVSTTTIDSLTEPKMILQEFVEQKCFESKTLRQFFEVYAIGRTWTYNEAVKTLIGSLESIHHDVSAEKYMDSPAPAGRVSLALLPSGTFVGLVDEHQTPWLLERKGSKKVRLVAPNEDYYNSRHIGHGWDFKLWHDDGYKDGSSVTDIEANKLVVKELVKVSSLDELVAIYKGVYRAGKGRTSCETKELEVKDAVDITLQWNEEELKRVFKDSLADQASFLLGKKLSVTKAERLIEACLSKKPAKGEEEKIVGPLVDKPVRDLNGFYFEPPSTIGETPPTKKAYSEEGYYGSADRIYSWDIKSGVLHYFITVGLLGISLLVGINRPGDRWEKAESTFNLLFTGLVAVLFFLANEKDEGEMRLLNSLKFRRAISTMTAKNELHCVIAVLTKEVDPGMYISPQSSFPWRVENPRGKTILQFGEISLQDLGVDTVKIFSQTLFVDVLGKNYRIDNSNLNGCRLELIDETQLALWKKEMKETRKEFLSVKGMNVKFVPPTTN